MGTTWTNPACVRAVLEHRVTSLVSLTTWPTSVSFKVLKPSLMTAKTLLYEIGKFGFITPVDKGQITTVKDSEC